MSLSNAKFRVNHRFIKDARSNNDFNIIGQGVNALTGDFNYVKYFIEKKGKIDTGVLVDCQYVSKNVKISFYEYEMKRYFVDAALKAMTSKDFDVLEMQKILQARGVNSLNFGAKEVAGCAGFIELEYERALGINADDYKTDYLILDDIATGFKRAGFDIFKNEIDEAGMK